MTEQQTSTRNDEAEEVGCYGLVGGWAASLKTHRKFSASECSRSDGPFYCPVCYSDAVVRKCTEKIDHFAHLSRLSPAIGAKDKRLHDSCAKEICEALNSKYPEGRWELERHLPEIKSKGWEKVVPDISGRIGDLRVVIEVQLSALSLSVIIKRTKEYAKRGISILWVVPLSTELGNQPFRPRLYERYLHSIYFGRTYYWWAGQGLILKPVHYGTASRYIPESEWYEIDGTLSTAGGYERDYKTIKTPLYGPDLLMDEDFLEEFRGEFTPENERKAVPACRIWRDKLPQWW